MCSQLSAKMGLLLTLNTIFIIIISWKMRPNRYRMCYPLRATNTKFKNNLVENVDKCRILPVTVIEGFYENEGIYK